MTIEQVIGICTAAGLILVPLAAWFGHFVSSRAQKRAIAVQANDSAGKMALELVNSLRAEVDRLSARVETLERDRNAYRSWSHVLWDHIHSDETPRLPAPKWPEELAR